MRQIKVAIIAAADDPKRAEFLINGDGKRLLFNSRDEAETWLSQNAKPETDYRLFDGMD